MKHAIAKYIQDNNGEITRTILKKEVDKIVSELIEKNKIISAGGKLVYIWDPKFIKENKKGFGRSYGYSKSN